MTVTDDLHQLQLDQMADLPPQVTCSACDALLDETPPSDANAVQPCPACGSRERVVHVFAFDGAMSEERSIVDGKDCRRRKGKPLTWFRRGEELHRDTGEWRYVDRQFDRENDRYYEQITRPDASVAEHKDEPLSEHRNRGTARDSKERQ
jgi:hypothetical protein